MSEWDNMDDIGKTVEEPKDEIEKLFDTLATLRLEIADVRSRQLTKDQVEGFQKILKETVQSVSRVENAAYDGSRESSARIEHLIKRMTQSNEYDIRKAVHQLDLARQETTEAANKSLWNQKRIVRGVILFSAFLGLTLGAWANSIIANYLPR